MLRHKNEHGLPYVPADKEGFCDLDAVLLEADAMLRKNECAPPPKKRVNNKHKQNKNTKRCKIHGRTVRALARHFRRGPTAWRKATLRGAPPQAATGQSVERPNTTAPVRRPNTDGGCQACASHRRAESRRLQVGGHVGETQAHARRHTENARARRRLPRHPNQQQDQHYRQGHSTGGPSGDAHVRQLPHAPQLQQKPQKK